MKKKLFFIILLVSLLLTGCRNKSDTFSQYKLPEEPEIKKTLDMLSNSILSKDAADFMSCFSSDCAFYNKISQYISSMKANDVNFSNFSINIENLNPHGDGIEASVKIRWDASVKGSKKSGSQVRSIYLSKENEAWKIKDYNFHHYDRPTIFIGNGSLLLSRADSMAKALGSYILPDTKHLQNTGDIILLGTAYDNASILELETANLTYVRVTEDYPGRGLGIVQVIPNVEQHRHVIIIQGSTLQDAKDAISFMTDYLAEEKYMEPGVYIIDNKSIRKAELLEVTSLTTLDYRKANETLEKAKSIMEYNIKLISDEINLEQNSVMPVANDTSTERRSDYKEAFSYAPANNKDIPHAISMGYICSFFLQEGLCTKAFQLPPSGSIDILNSVTMLEKDMPSVIALLRLAGFDTHEVFLCKNKNNTALFANVEEGYALDPTMDLLSGVFQNHSFQEIEHMENERYYIDFKKDFSNMAKEEISNIIGNINNAFNLEKKLLQSKITRRQFILEENPDHISLPYDINDIYAMLQANAPYYQSSKAFINLKETKEALRKAMGKLLCMKLKKHIISLASKYPGSQYDYGLYAAGFINVNHPEVYAEAAKESTAVKRNSSEISSAYKEADDKIQGIISLLSTIKKMDKEEDLLLHPDICLERKIGKAADKALLAYGLYSNLFNSTDEAWIAMGEDSAYLVIKDDYGYKYIDCRYNSIRRAYDPTIYLCFNEKHVYNGKLGIGNKPEFLINH